MKESTLDHTARTKQHATQVDVANVAEWPATDMLA